MKKLLNKPWFSGLLALAAFLFVAQSLRPTAARSLPSATTDSSVSTDVAPTSPQRDIPQILSTLSIASNLRDPFAPRGVFSAPVADKTVAPAQVENSETFLLTAIWRQNNTSLALINGVIQAPGAQIGSILVESIQPGGIWVTHPKGRDFIMLGAPFTFTATASINQLQRTDS